MSSPSAFSASIAGSSWKAALTSGVRADEVAGGDGVAYGAPCGLRPPRSFLTVVARYSAPPAGVPLTRPPLPVGGSMLPWKSLNASRWPVSGGLGAATA